MLLHDPQRPQDTSRYWNHTVVLWNGDPVVVKVRDEKFVVHTPAGEIHHLPLTSDELAVVPIVAGYRKGRLCMNVAQRRALKGYSGGENLLGISGLTEVAEVCKRDSSGDVYLLGEHHGNMTTEQFREFRKEFLCVP